MDANAFWTQTVGYSWQGIVVLLWCVFWLSAVNWKKVWPVLAQGGWAPAVLIGLVVTLAWSRIDERSCNCLGFMTLPNFWWQFGTVSTLAAIALFCGWLQGYLNWAPAEINLDPPPVSHGHGHHGHAHH